MFNRAIFTKIMRRKHTILVPQMSPLHFELISEVMRLYGCNLKVLESTTREDIDEGLKYINNDICYPAGIVIGQVLNALKSGEYDLNSTSVMISQTGGSCRETNYIELLRKALKDSGFENIPVVSFDMMGINRQHGFRFSLSMIKRVIYAVVYADLLMKVSNRIRPYERIPGSTNLLLNVWVRKCKRSLKKARFSEFVSDVNQIAGDFDFLGTHENIKKPKVGVVGEILMKFHPQANNEIVRFIEEEGAEAVVPGLAEFILYAVYNNVGAKDSVEISKFRMFVSRILINYIESLRKEVNNALELSKRFTSVHTIVEMANKASNVLSLGNKSGEGWLLTAEMIGLVEEGVENIICTQPFGGLPNHVTGKGILKQIKKRHKDVNIIALDFDSGASEVNQLNQVKSLISEAFDKMKIKNAGKLREKLGNNG